MRVERLKERDLPEIAALVKKEFPYVALDEAGIRERVASGRVIVLKAVEGKQLLGFIEAEIIEEGVARINGVTVKPGARRKGVAGKLMEEMLSLLKGKKVKRVMLLVKQGNEEAKRLYEKQGFRFMGLYQRAIDQSVVEEMELDLAQGESPKYVG